MPRWRFRDWRFRDKVLVVTALPVVVFVVLFSAAFFAGLERVWRDAVPTQSALQRLDALSREYQSEVRELVLLRLPETVEEVVEIEEEFEASLDDLGRLRGAGPLAIQLGPKVADLVAQGRRIVATTSSEQAPAGLSDEQEELLEAFEESEVALEDDIDVLRMASERQVGAAFRRFSWIMLGSGGLALVVAVLVAIALARWFDRPIDALRQASERLLDGDFRARDAVPGRDELGELAEGFDRGAAEIRRLLAEEQAHLEDLRSNQAQLLQSGKMAAVGELASGVAHEINNPLSAVLTYSILLREKAEALPAEALEPLPKLVERLSLIESAAKRCRNIADNLLAFARKDESERTAIDLGTVIDDALGLMSAPLRRRGMAVERRVGGSLPAVLGNAGQLCQVLVNLIGNAIQAASDGGRVLIVAHRESEVCRLLIEDDGPGIPPHVKERIFEPFVTTKPAGEGTGLGLSIVYSIVQAHEGEIRCDSEIGRTTFTIDLPLAGGGGEG
ncbi:MAG: ATP-binding protein [Holophagales bacterium]|nr:ATP-binding protein [Holophagales bacterium]